MAIHKILLHAISSSHRTGVLQEATLNVSKAAYDGVLRGEYKGPTDASFVKMYVCLFHPMDVLLGTRVFSPDFLVNVNRQIFWWTVWTSVNWHANLCGPMWAKNMFLWVSPLILMHRCDLAENIMWTQIESLPLKLSMCSHFFCMLCIPSSLQLVGMPLSFWRF